MTLTARPGRPVVVALVAVVALGLPSPVGPSPVDAARTARVAAIAPGSVNRSSLHLDATYQATLKLTWATRAIWVDSTAEIRDTSGGPRFVMGLHRASRCATARLDLAIYAYSARCYFETIYIQGGNLLVVRAEVPGAVLSNWYGPGRTHSLRVTIWPDGRSPIARYTPRDH